MEYTQTHDKEGKREEPDKCSAAHLHIRDACMWCMQLCCYYKTTLNATDGCRTQAGAAKCCSGAGSMLTREQYTKRSCADCHNKSRRTQIRSLRFVPRHRELAPRFCPTQRCRERTFPGTIYGSGVLGWSTLPGAVTAPGHRPGNPDSPDVTNSTCEHDVTSCYIKALSVAISSASSSMLPLELASMYKFLSSRSKQPHEAAAKMNKLPPKARNVVCAAPLCLAPSSRLLRSNLSSREERGECVSSCFSKQVNG
jgi:hypothetical protein